jgi:hypothetical protein
MAATSFGVVGDFEGPHIVYDSAARKWRIILYPDFATGLVYAGIQIGLQILLADNFQGKKIGGCRLLLK